MKLSFTATALLLTAALSHAQTVSNITIISDKLEAPSSMDAWADTDHLSMRIQALQSHEPHRTNIQLRPGEKLTRNWSDNGTLEYNPPIQSLATNAITYDNLTVKDGTLQPADPTKPATLVIRMPSSYAYIDGKLHLTCSLSDNVSVSLSDNNGLDWKPMTGVNVDNIRGLRVGNESNTIFDLQSHIARKYDYRLKFEINGRTSLNGIKLTHDIQHAQHPLPALDKGTNMITFFTGEQEGTIATHSNLNQNALIPITTPGNMIRLRMPIHHQAEASFDQGKTFTPITTLFNRIPPYTKSTLIRLTGKTATTDNLTIYADYLEPHGNFAPVKITYAYEENSQLKTNTHIATNVLQTYAIRCETKPKMKSITLELAR